MDPVSPVATVAAGWWAAVSLLRLGTVAAAFTQPAARRRAAARRDQPPVSVVIPVAQMEPELDAAFASAFSQDYPSFEVLITAADEDSAVIDAARAVAGRFPAISTRFLLGNRRRTLNPKVSNIAPAIAAAAHDLVVVKDSNVRLPAGHLAELVRNLTPGTGMVCAVPIGVQPEGFPAEVECAVTNGHAAPWLMGASRIGIDIGFGKVMLFDRRDLEGAGGVGVMASTFGDDHALAKAFGRAGLRTVFTAGVVHRVMARRTLRDVWHRQLRWMMIRRGESPLAFVAEPFFTAGAATVAAGLAGPALGVPGWVPAVATLAAWLITEALVVAGRGWGWFWRFPLAALCREPLLLGLWLRAWTSREVSWAGARFDVDGTSLGAP